MRFVQKDVHQEGLVMANIPYVPAQDPGRLVRVSSPLIVTALTFGNCHPYGTQI